MSLRISVVTAVLNRAQTLGAALRSVRAQRWHDVEHIVVDGGSTDGTLDVIDEHRAGIATVVSGPDAGLYDALNKGIREASGDVVGFMHADDEYAYAGALGRIASAFEDPAVGAVYGDLVYVKNDLSRVVRYWRAGQYRRRQLAQGWMPPHPTFYVRREIYSRFGGFDTRYRIAADYENMLRILWRGKVEAAYIPEVLVRMRIGGLSNGSLFNVLHKSREDYAAMRQNGIGGLQALLLKNVTKLPQFVQRAAGAYRIVETPT
jgi:glycosyltransferase involved in cell wall biosynthesis